MGIKLFTLLLYIKNKSNTLLSITNVFSHWNTSISSLSLSDTIEYTESLLMITVLTNKSRVEDIVNNLKTLEEVNRIVILNPSQIAHHKLALFKMDLESFNKNKSLQDLLMGHEINAVEFGHDFIVFSKSGNVNQINKLKEKLKSLSGLEYLESSIVPVQIN